MDREKNMISVCVPSRGRPEKCADMVQSLLDNAHWDVDINIYLNQNDQMLDVYKNLIDNKYLHVGDQYFANHGWNLMAEKATCSLLFMNGDAEIMQTKDWDKISFDTACNAFPKRIGVLVPDDGRGKGGAPHFMVTRQWYELLGYMSHPMFLHWHVDTYAVELAESAGVLKRINIINKAKKIIGDSTAKLSRDNKITHRDEYMMQWARKHLIPMEREKIEREINR
tara:strand:- start:5474 stop:6148 length:675 start_codon:yes stop_codon:yes gene_type:complete